MRKRQKKAAGIRDEAVRDAKEKANASLLSAKEVGEKKMEDALKETQEQIASLKEAALAKEEEAVAAVIADLV